MVLHLAHQPFHHRDGTGGGIAPAPGARDPPGAGERRRLRVPGRLPLR